MDKLYFINPIGDHKVFNGWHKFFDKFFNYKVLCDGEILGYSDKKIFESIGEKKRINFKTNFVHIYKCKQNLLKNDLLLIGDIFTNTLCYTVRKGQKIYYSEFFLDEKSFIIKFIFYAIGFLFFHNKKFILPHELGFRTFSKISKKCFYLPILYEGDICYSEKNEFKEIELLFVGRIDAPVKNVKFLIDNYFLLREKYPYLHLTLVGKINDSHFLDEYSDKLDNGYIKHVPYVKNPGCLSKIYANSDIFILPSLKEPIGAVIQEAMAHGCAILCSDLCGGGCYIEDGKNGYKFKTNDSENFREKLELLIGDIDKLKQFKKESADIIKSKYDTNNSALMKQYFDDLNKFISNK